MLHSVAALALALALPAAAATPPLAGVWGGDQMVVTFTETGARLQAGCAQGAIPGPVRPDGRGRFAATGAFQAFHGGPQRADEDAAATPAASFAGRLEGDTLHLTVTAPPDAPRDYLLKRGVQPKLVRCL